MHTPAFPPAPAPASVPGTPSLYGSVRPGDVLDAAVVERLLAERIVVVAGELDDAAAHRVTAQLLLLDAIDARRPVTVCLAAVRGTVTAALAVHDAVRRVRAPVATVATGLVGPAAALVLAAGTPGRRAALPHARVLLGRPDAGEVAALGDAAARARLHGELRQELVALTAGYCGRPVAELTADVEAGRVLTAAEAAGLGFVDPATEAGTAPPTGY